MSGPCRVVSSSTGARALVLGGTFIAPISQWFVFWLLARYGSVMEAGVFAALLAYSTPLFIAAGWGLRNTLITLRRSYPFAVYLRIRVLLLGAAAVVLLGIGAWVRADPVMLWAVLLMKVSDGVTDLLYGPLQRQQALAPYGLLMIANGVVSAVLSALMAVLCPSPSMIVFGSSLGSTATTALAIVALRRRPAEPAPEPLVEWTPFSPAEPFTNRRTGFFSQGLTSSEPPANMNPAAYDSPEDNPELYEATLTPEALARMRQEESATGDTIMRRVPAAAPTTPSAFLIYAGSAPVEVVRDVIIGRDPNTRVLTGRPMAAPLRVPSPGSEISRSHCAVMATAPGVWSLMDLASVNGSILVHPDGSSEDVPAMVGVPLADGDLIDLGEGVTVEFRVR